MPTMFQLSHVLAVTAFIALLAAAGNAHSRTLHVAVERRGAAADSFMPPVGTRPAATSDRDRHESALATVNSGVPELEGEEQEPPPDVHAVTRLSREPLRNFSPGRAELAVEPMACWVSPARTLWPSPGCSRPPTAPAALRPARPFEPSYCAGSRDLAIPFGARRSAP